MTTGLEDVFGNSLAQEFTSSFTTESSCADFGGDTDGDGVCDYFDNCPDTPNASQTDSDGDGSGDVCDPCPNDPENDADGDGLCGDVDHCPYEDSRGFDADGDGCIDTFDGLTDVITTLVTEGVIDEELQNSLLTKVENAENSADKEKICTAINKLEALKKQVNAQRGNKISNESADLIIDYTENLITQLLSQLPPGESC